MMKFHAREKATALPKQRHRLQPLQAESGYAAYASDYNVYAFKLRSWSSSIYSLETKPARCATSFQGASTASAGSSTIWCAKSFILLITRRSRRAVNQFGGRISKSLGANSSLTSAVKTSAQDLPQTACANRSLSERSSSSRCRAKVVLRPQ